MKLRMFLLPSKTKIKLTKEQQEFLCTAGTVVFTEKGNEYFNIPFWYKKEKDGLFTQFLPGKLPKDLSLFLKD